MRRRILLTLLAGILSGFSVSFFLITLDLVVELHQRHPGTLYSLPVIGALLGLIHRFYGKSGKTDTGLILEEIHSPTAALPLRFAPLVYLSTLFTQFAGGSAGREGAAVQISASVCDQLSHRRSLDPAERKTLLISGVSAGFGAAIGAPFAGILFGFEVIRRHGLNIRSFLHVSTATMIAVLIARILPVNHLLLPHFGIAGISSRPAALITLALSPAVFALLVRVFFAANHAFVSLLGRVPGNPVFRGFAGGTLLLLLFSWQPLDAYQGLGIEGLIESFHSAAAPSAPVLKLLLTALTLAAGFKGGEFVPLFFAGATAGSALGGIAGIDPSVLAALGCVSVFGAAAKTPFTCMVLAVELFGIGIAPFAVTGILLTSLLSGKKSLYTRSS